MRDLDCPLCGGSGHIDDVLDLASRSHMGQYPTDAQVDSLWNRIMQADDSYTDLPHHMLARAVIELAQASRPAPDQAASAAANIARQAAPDSTALATVDMHYHWRPITESTPRGTKMQLINREAGVGVYGSLATDQGFWTHWAPMPTFKDRS